MVNLLDFIKRKKKRFGQLLRQNLQALSIVVKPIKSNLITYRISPKSHSTEYLAKLILQFGCGRKNGASPVSDAFN
jgi:hypothetical protein